MRYRLRDLLVLPRSPLGRRALASHLRSAAWPLLRLAAQLYRRTLARRVRVVAVVGSYGKTTTWHAVSAALDAPLTHAAIGGLSRVALSVLRIRPGQNHAALEVQIDRRGHMAHHARTVRPDVVVVTSIGSEHHRSLGTLDDTLEEKAQILKGLRPGGVVVLNGDDPRVRGLAARTGARVLTFGGGEANDVRASDIRIDWPHGTRCTLHAAGATRELRLRLLGAKMVNPALAAIAVALAEGRALEPVLAALERLAPVPGRMQLVALPNGAHLLRDEYKSSLETIHAALDVLAEIPARRIVVVGEVSEPPGSQGALYREVGERLGAIADRVIVVGANFQRYAAGATRAGLARSALVDAGRSIAQAEAALRAELRAGDVVLIKGRDTQRLERLALRLQGRTVGCEITSCHASARCEGCPMCAAGWPDRAAAAIVCAPGERSGQITGAATA